MSNALLRSATIVATLSATASVFPQHTPSPNQDITINYVPQSGYNRLTPENHEAISAEVKTDTSGYPLSVSTYLPDDVVNKNLPTRISDDLVCNLNGECVGGYHVFFEITNTPELFPYKTIQINWNPEGHPPGVFQKNNFDFHFHRQTLGELKEIEPGNYGPEKFSDDANLQEKASKQLPEDTAVRLKIQKVLREHALVALR